MKRWDHIFEPKLMHTFSFTTLFHICKFDYPSLLKILISFSNVANVCLSCQCGAIRRFYVTTFYFLRHKVGLEEATAQGENEKCKYWTLANRQKVH